jgi:hypothetical protein
MKNNINMSLVLLEWIKKELKWITYELNKFLELFLYYKSFLILIYLFYLTSGLRPLFQKSSGGSV